MWKNMQSVLRSDTWKALPGLFPFLLDCFSTDEADRASCLQMEGSSSLPVSGLDPALIFSSRKVGLGHKYSLLL